MSRDLPIGQVRFCDYYHPSLEAGDYTIEVNDTLSILSPEETKAVPVLPIQKFTVKGPRFTLPAEDIQARHPAASSIGEYGTQLPFVVLTRKSLPWEHTIVDERNTPWLALLVFSEEELELPTGDGLTTENINTRTIVDNVGKILADEKGVLKPKLEALADDVKNTSCASIKMRKNVFKQVVPHLSELKYLAHCREINTSDKDTPITLQAKTKENKIAVRFKKPGATTPLETKRDEKSIVNESKLISEELLPDNSQWFSVLLANRLPKTPIAASSSSTASDSQAALQFKKNIVHLVSLEGMGELLKAIEANSEDNYKYIEFIQLISLISWSFQCSANQPHSFGDLMKIVIEKSTETITTDKSMTPTDQQLKLYRLPVNSTLEIPTPIKERLNQGYVPMLQATATGEKTYCWYRGPFTPYRIEKLPALPETSRTGSDLMIYDDVQKVFDVSYATAWQIGRMLALSSYDWCQTLLEYRRMHHNKMALSLRTTKLKAMLKTRLSDSKDAESSTLLSNPTPLGFLSKMLHKDLKNIQAFTKGEISTDKNSIKFASPRLPKPHYAFGDLLKQFKLKASDESDSQADNLQKLVLWLIRLKRLEEVPFYYLVPDEQLIPSESIRFFFIDPNWLSCLVDGALSIGVHNQFDALINQQIKEQLKEFKTLDPINKIYIHPQDAIIGSLLRSTVVARWPGLRVLTHDYKEGVAVVEKVRWQRLSDNVLLELFSNIPEELILSEPAEQIRFGVREEEEEKDHSQKLVMDLRHIGGKNIGCAIGRDGDISEIPTELILNESGPASLLRDSQDTVINISKLVDRLSATELQKELVELQAREKMTSAELAIQFVKAPEAVTFSFSSAMEPKKTEDMVTMRSVNRVSFFRGQPSIKPQPLTFKPALSFNSEIPESNRQPDSDDIILEL